MSENRRRGRGRAPRAGAAHGISAGADQAQADALVLRAGRGVLLALVALVPLAFSTRTLEAFEFPKVNLLVAAGVALVAGTMAVALERMVIHGPRALGRSLARGLRRDPLGWGVLLYLASAIISTLASISPRTSFWGAHESYFGLVTVCAYVALYFSVRALCRTPAQARALLGAGLVGVTGAAAYALLQFTGRDPIGWTRTHEFLGLFRAFGTMGNPNFLGALMALGVPLALALGLRALRRRRRTRAALFAAIALLGLCALGVSLSRGALLAALAGVAAFALGQLLAVARKEARRRLVFAGTAALLLAGLAVALVPRARSVATVMTARIELTLTQRPQERPVGGLALGQEARLALWKAAWDMFRERPLTGVGLDAYQLAYQRHRDPVVWSVEGHHTPGKAHNEALHVLATQGLPGGIALMLLVGGGVIAFARALRAQPEERELAVGLGAALVAFAVQDAFSFTVAGYGTLALACLALLAALGGAAPEESARPAAAGATPALRLGQAAIAVLGAIGLWLLVARPLRADIAAQRGVVARHGLPGRAVPEFAQAVRFNPARDLHWAQLGVARYELALALSTMPARRGQLDEARAAFERAIALVPVNSYHHGGRARVLAEMARQTPPQASREQAYKAFEDAMALDPGNPSWPAEAGRLALEADDLARAEAWGQRGLEVQPDYGPAAWLVGTVALQRALPARELADDHARASAFGPVGEALRDAATRLRWYDENGLRALCASHAAYALSAAGRIEEARAVAELGTQVDPDDADGHYNLGKLYERLDDAGRAQHEYRRTLQLRPGHPEAQRALAALQPH